MGQHTSGMGNVLDSELRIFQAGPWREIRRRSFDRPLLDLAISADGATTYAVLGPIDSQQRRNMLGIDARRTVLVSLPNVGGRPGECTARALDAGIVGIAGAP